MHVNINGDEISVPVGISTWGDLLDWIETDYLRGGECITHVYLNGMEALNYRYAGIYGEPISNVTPVAIKCGDFDSIIEDSMTELDQELTSSIELSGEIIRLFEDREQGEAYDRLDNLLDSIRIFSTILSEDPGWADAPIGQISGEDISDTLERALTQLVSAQEKHHWVSICDVLEFEIVPVLESWQELAKRTYEHAS